MNRLLYFCAKENLLLYPFGDGGVLANTFIVLIIPADGIT